jgi:hypothetical protein
MSSTPADVAEQGIQAWKVRVARRRNWRKATAGTNASVLLPLRLHDEAGPTSSRTNIRTRR